jgi:hypothetical protein
MKPARCAEMKVSNSSTAIARSTPTTGGRSEEHGYNDFLPAMRNFDLLVANHHENI